MVSGTWYLVLHKMMKLELWDFRNFEFFSRLCAQLLAHARRRACTPNECMQAHIPQNEDSIYECTAVYKHARTNALRTVRVTAVKPGPQETPTIPPTGTMQSQAT